MKSGAEVEAVLTVISSLRDGVQVVVASKSKVPTR